MAIKQLSVFVENKQGSLHDITEALAKANINLRSMSVADTSNYGIVRIIADKPDEAKALLDNDGQAANVRLVNAFAVPDVPGGLSQVLKLLEGNGVNIEYMYALITTEAGKAYSVMRTGDTEKTDEILLANGIELLDEAKKEPTPMRDVPDADSLVNVIKCQNTRCISQTEQELDQRIARSALPLASKIRLI